MDKERIDNWASMLNSLEKGDSCIEKRLAKTMGIELANREYNLICHLKVVKKLIDRANKITNFDEVQRTQCLDDAFDKLVHGYRMLMLIEMYNEESSNEKSGKVYWYMLDALSTYSYDHVMSVD